MKNNIKQQYDDGYYANAKNIASYYIGERIFRPSDWALWYLATSASALGDYYMADEIFRYYLFAKPDLEWTQGEIERNEKRRVLCRAPEIEFYDGINKYSYEEKAYVSLEYTDDFLQNPFSLLSLRGTINYYKTDKKAAFFELIKRISYCFSKIKKSIGVYLIKDKDNFNEVYEKVVKVFNKDATFVWNENVYTAVCLYDDPSRHIIFFDENYIEYDILKCVGVISHEMTHLEQHDTNIRSIFHSLPLSASGFKQKENMILNERLTDLQVISKGFGYELHCDRRKLGLTCISNFDQVDVLKIIDAASYL